jgi:hypothetical protein
MPSTNGYHPKRTILYTRVPSEERASKGCSLSDQLASLRVWATHEGYKVIEE